VTSWIKRRERDKSLNLVFGRREEGAKRKVTFGVFTGRVLLDEIPSMERMKSEMASALGRNAINRKK